MMILMLGHRMKLSFWQTPVIPYCHLNGPPVLQQLFRSMLLVGLNINSVLVNG
jgi:hypothetical protein